MDSSVCVFSISACLQDELLCLWGLSDMYYNGRVRNKSQTTGSYTILWTHKNTAHAGSTVLAAGVVLPRYGGLNYVRGINEVIKTKTWHVA